MRCNFSCIESFYLGSCKKLYFKRTYRLLAEYGVFMCKQFQKWRCCERLISAVTVVSSWVKPTDFSVSLYS
jgi:hypothetical protein